MLPLPAVGLRYLGYLQHYLWGVALYFLLPRIRLTGAVGCGLLVLFLLSSWSAPFAHTVGWLVVLALVLRLFLSDGPLRCLNRSNLSYGIYLSHCPLVQLALVWSLPDWGVWLMAFSSLGVAYGLYREVKGVGLERQVVLCPTLSSYLFFYSMNMKRILLFFFFLIGIGVGHPLRAAQSTRGLWTYHLSYQKAEHIVTAGNVNYFLCEGNLMSYDVDDQSIRLLDKLSGLSDRAISHIQWSTTENCLVILL